MWIKVCDDFNNFSENEASNHNLNKYFLDRVPNFKSSLHKDYKSFIKSKILHRNTRKSTNFRIFERNREKRSPIITINHEKNKTLQSPVKDISDLCKMREESRKGGSDLPNPTVNLPIFFYLLKKKLKSQIAANLCPSRENNALIPESVARREKFCNFYCLKRKKTEQKSRGSQ